MQMSRNRGSVKGFAATRGKQPFEHLGSIGMAVAQIASIVLLAGALALTGCGGGGGGATPISLQSITLSPVSPSIAAGTAMQLSATAQYSDGSHADVTSEAAWSSSNTATATIGAATGKALSVAVGTATLTATLQGISASTTLTVTSATLASITVSGTV